MARTNPNQIYDDIADVVISRQEEWRDRALCKGQGNSMWFPQVGGKYQDSLAAHKVCGACPVERECFEAWTRMPREQQKHGVWAGRDARIWDSG